MSHKKHRVGGEWIIFTDSFWTKPKVLAMAARLAESLGGLPTALPGIDVNTLMRHVICSALSRLFVTVNKHANESNTGEHDAELFGTSLHYIDDVAELPGLGSALEAVGWVVLDAERRVLRFPNYLSHNRLVNGQKRRGRQGNSDSPDARRMREKRANKAGRTNDEQIDPNMTEQGVNKPAEREVESETEIQKNEQKSLEQGGKLGELDRLKRRVDGLRPASWGRMRHWSPGDEESLLRAAGTLQSLAEDDWLLLAWFIRWAEKPANQARCPRETNITTKRAAMLDDLGSFHARAEGAWRSEGRPRLRMGGTEIPKTAAPPPPPLPDPETARATAQSFRALVEEEAAC